METTNCVGVGIGNGIAIVAVVGIVTWAWTVVNWVWLKPKKLEKCLRQQGFNGNSYRFLFGDIKENSTMLRDAMSKPIGLSDDIVPRVLPFVHQSLNTYGDKSLMWMGQTPRVNVMDPELMKDVLSKINNFRKPVSNPLIKLLGTGLASHEGEQWAKHRRIINPAFHILKLKNMLPAFHLSCSQMTREWELLLEKGSCELDVWPYLQNMTSDVISRTAFGSSYEEGTKIFHLLKELASLTLQLLQSIYIPGWRYIPTKINRRMKKIDKEIQVSLKGIINKREKAMKEGEAANDDLLGILLESNYKEINENGNDKKVGMSIKEVINECKLFYFAGQETTSVLLLWTMVLLSKHQNWQSLAREEVLQVFGKEKPNFDGLNQLKIVAMILYEVLRLYPPIPVLNRAVYTDTNLGKFSLPAGIQLSIPVIIVQCDHKHWGEDAKEFKPDRFSEGVSKATKSPLAFIPFGWGPRICIGQNFAMTEAKMAMAMILQRFSFEISPSYTHAPIALITLQPQYGAPLILHKL